MEVALLSRMSADKSGPLPAAAEVELTEADIPGAMLEEPLEAHNVVALKWWLLCCGKCFYPALSPSFISWEAVYKHIPVLRSSIPANSTGISRYTVQARSPLWKKLSPSFFHCCKGHTVSIVPHSYNKNKRHSQSTHDVQTCIC